MKIKFYGVRGSLPAPGRNTVEYGGNTSCFEIVSKEGESYIFDAGSGIRDLGNELMVRYQGRVKTRVFITHDHWDHIQGFPFFVPAYVPGCKVEVYSGDKDLAKKLAEAQVRANGHLSGKTLEEMAATGDTVVQSKEPRMNHTKEIFQGQQDTSRGYFPVSIEQMGSELTFRDLKQYEIVTNGLTVSAMFHNAHPPGMFSYQIKEYGRRVVYTGDYEHDGGENDEKMITWANEADVLIIDGQYTPEEYTKKKGWGHSHIEKICELAAKAKVKRVYVTHHDPLHNDAQLTQMESRAKKYMQEVVKSNIPVIFAREEMEVEV
jgi:phosphoribosyl 1,2-cyclic phosphodiesterase